MTVIVIATPARILGKSTVSPNDSVEFLPPRILAGVCRAATNAQDFAPNYPSQSRKRHAVARRITRHSYKNDLNSCQLLLTSS